MFLSKKVNETKIKDSGLSKAELLYLFISFLLPILFPLFNAIVLVQILIVIFLMTKLLCIFYEKHLPKYVLLGCLCLVILVIAFHLELLVNQEIVFVFILFSTLKLLELKVLRDAFLIFLINILMALSSLMFTTSILGFGFLFVSFLFNFYVCLVIFHPQLNLYHKKIYVQLVLKFLLVSTPCVFILFFLFPRIDPLWKAPSNRSITGLSEQMTPNSLSQLVQDGGMAFRVKFNKEKPKNHQLYWRGPVLSFFDGKTWRRNSVKGKRLNIFEDKKLTLNYAVYHDGSTNKWLTPLDLPVSSVQGLVFNAEAEVYHPDQPLSGVYHVTSNPLAKINSIYPLERSQNTHLPANLFPKTKQLAKKLYQGHSSPKAFIDNVLNYFATQGFYYDLEPPLGNSDLDTFLFENRVGYCEHYASAFAVILRSQNIPARIVTGYQGGEFNSISQEMEVKQLNAHAWVEAYIDNEGWVRFDPTAAVAPNRVSRGSPLGVARNDSQIKISERLENLSENYHLVMNFIRATNAFWQNWIVDYNLKKKEKLFDFNAIKTRLITLFVFFTVLIALIFWYRILVRKKDVNRDKVTDSMRKLISYLSRNHYVITLNKPLIPQVREYREELGTEAYQKLLAIMELYYQIRYQSQHTSEMEGLLIYKVNELVKKSALNKR